MPAAPRLAVRVGRYAHARQFKRMRKALRQLKGYAGRIRRDLRRHLQEIPEGGLRDKVLEALWLVGRRLGQGSKSKDKIYSLHEPEVDCISKGKARTLSSERTAFRATPMMGTPWHRRWNKSPSWPTRSPISLS